MVEVNIIDYITKLPSFLTLKTVDFLSAQGLVVTERWSSLLWFLIAGLMIYLGIKITKPIVKWGLVILALALIVGLIFPTW